MVSYDDLGWTVSLTCMVLYDECLTCMVSYGECLIRMVSYDECLTCMVSYDECLETLVFPIASSNVCCMWGGKSKPRWLQNPHNLD